MAPIAIVFGVLLGVLGGGMYVYTDMVSITAMIPAFFGLPLIVLGALALNEKMRKHAMHLAAIIGLLGFAFPLGRVIFVSIRSGFVLDEKSGTALAMSVLCLIFLVLCIKSFIDARKRRQAEAQAVAPQ
jgi:ABC-type uncharacterized transport system permease subunit